MPPIAVSRSNICEGLSRQIVCRMRGFPYLRNSRLAVNDPQRPSSSAAHASRSNPIGSDPRLEREPPFICTPLSRLPLLGR